MLIFSPGMPPPQCEAKAGRSDGVFTQERPPSGTILFTAVS